MNASARPCHAVPCRAAIAWTMPVSFSLLLSPLSPDACFAFFFLVCFLSLHRRHIQFIGHRGEQQPEGSSHEAQPPLLHGMVGGRSTSTLIVCIDACCMLHVACCMLLTFVCVRHLRGCEADTTLLVINKQKKRHYLGLFLSPANTSSLLPPKGTTRFTLMERTHDCSYSFMYSNTCNVD